VEPYYSSVVGTEGFREGCHYWEYIIRTGGKDMRQYGLTPFYVGVSSNKGMDFNEAPWKQQNTYGWHASDE